MDDSAVRRTRDGHCLRRIIGAASRSNDRGLHLRGSLRIFEIAHLCILNVTINRGVTAPVLRIVNPHITVQSRIFQPVCLVNREHLVGVGSNPHAIVVSIAIEPCGCTAIRIKRVTVSRIAADVPFQILGHFARNLTLACIQRDRGGGRRIARPIVVRHGATTIQIHNHKDIRSGQIRDVHLLPALGGNSSPKGNQHHSQQKG